MNAVVEPVRPGEFLITEVDHNFRENGTIAEGEKLAAGTVLAKDSGGEFVQLDDTADDGTEVAAGILYGAVDASEAAKTGVIVSKLAVVADNSLTWPTEISSEDKTAAIAKLAESFLIVR